MVKVVVDVSDIWPHDDPTLRHAGRKYGKSNLYFISTMITCKACCELTMTPISKVPTPVITRLTLRHQCAFWKALSSIAPRLRANCCSRSVWLRASARAGSRGRGRKDAIGHAECYIRTCLHAHESRPGLELTEREDEANAKQ